MECLHLEGNLHSTTAPSLEKTGKFPLIIQTQLRVPLPEKLSGTSDASLQAWTVDSGVLR